MSEGHTLPYKFREKCGPFLTPLPLPLRRFFVYTGTLPDSEKAKVDDYTAPPSEVKAETVEEIAGGGEGWSTEAA